MMTCVSSLTTTIVAQTPRPKWKSSSSNKQQEYHTRTLELNEKIFSIIATSGLSHTPFTSTKEVWRNPMFCSSLNQTPEVARSTNYRKCELSQCECRVSTTARHLTTTVQQCRQQLLRTIHYPYNKYNFNKNSLQKYLLKKIRQSNTPNKKSVQR